MTLQELITRFRVLAGDRQQPYFWEDDEVAGWLSDAQAQACVRGRLLREDADAAICEIALAADQHTYPLHRTVYELIDLRIAPAGGGRSQPLKLVTREWLEAEVPDWRDCQRPARYAIQNDTSLRVVGAFNEGDVLRLECYRLPKRAMVSSADKPEIHEAHHEHLLLWALHRAFSVVDADAFDPQKAAQAEDAFTRYFGLQPDSDLRRATRHDVPQVNQAVLP